MVEKLKTIFEIIHRTNLKTFESSKDLSSKGAKSKGKFTKHSEKQRLVDIASSRGIPMEELLCYDMTLSV